MIDWGKESRPRIRKVKPQRKTAENLAHRISMDIPAAMLALRTRLIVVDIREKYRCRRSTAFHAVSLARVRIGWEIRNG